MRKIILVFLFQMISSVGFSQELMTVIQDADVTQLLDLPGVVTLTDSSRIAGTVTGVYLSKGQLTNITLKLTDGSKRKFAAAELISAKIRLKTPTVFSVVDNQGQPIKKVIYTQVVFEQFVKDQQMGKTEFRQLLNPVYDSRIKIFADLSNSGRSPVINSGASGNSMLIVIKGSVVLYVKGTDYKSDFKRIFSDCEKVVEAVSEEKIEFSGIASHTLLYDHYCGQVK